jgi:hypothetical protein
MSAYSFIDITKNDRTQNFNHKGIGNLQLAKKVSKHLLHFVGEGPYQAKIYSDEKSVNKFFFELMQKG